MERSYFGLIIVQNQYSFKHHHLCCFPTYKTTISRFRQRCLKSPSGFSSKAMDQHTTTLSFCFFNEIEAFLKVMWNIYINSVMNCPKFARSWKNKHHSSISLKVKKIQDMKAKGLSLSSLYWKVNNLFFLTFSDKENGIVLLGRWKWR